MIVVAGDLSLVGGRDYPRTYQKFRLWFPDEWTFLRCSSRPLAPTRTPSPSVAAEPAQDESDRAQTLVDEEAYVAVETSIVDKECTGRD